MKCEYENIHEDPGQIKEIQLLSGSAISEQTFFPLAIDDYFMAVAILSGRFSKNVRKYY